MREGPCGEFQLVFLGLIPQIPIDGLTPHQVIVENSEWLQVLSSTSHRHTTDFAKTNPLP